MQAVRFHGSGADVTYPCIEELLTSGIQCFQYSQLKGEPDFPFTVSRKTANRLAAVDNHFCYAVTIFAHEPDSVA